MGFFNSQNLSTRKEKLESTCKEMWIEDVDIINQTLSQ